MDIIVYTPEEFEENKEILNTLAYFIAKSNKLMYEKDVRTIYYEGAK